MEFSLPKRYDNSNKSTYGRVLNIAGSDYMPGSAYLSSVSALKIGCGYVFLCSSDRVINIVACQNPNIVFIPHSKLAQNIAKADVISIGCGIGTEAKAVKNMSILVDNTNIETPVIVDADGLNILAQNDIDLTYDFIRRKFKKLIFTPHPKEASRLLECGLDDVLNNIEGSAKKITEKFNCVTVLKTHKTFVYSPDGKSFTNNTGNNSMAKAGSGDVLTGIISGLCAQGMDIFEASCLGVYLHGLCGDIARNELTEYCVMAQDLISSIPNAIKHIKI